MRPVSLALSLALGITVASPGTARGQCNAPRDAPPAGVCPIIPIAGGPNLFDRCFLGPPLVGKPTDFGNAACNAFRDSNLLLQNMGRNADKFVNDARKDFQALVTVATKDAIDPGAARMFAGARGEIGEIIDSVKAYTRDPMCGVNGTIKGANVILQEVSRDLVAAGGIAGKTGDAARAAAPAVGEVATALTELQGLAQDIKAAGAGAENERKKLDDALKSLQKNLGDLAALDMVGAAAAAVSMITQVGPFLGSAGACAGLLVTSTGAADSSVASLAVGTGVCPETGGTACALGLSASAVTGAAATLSGLSSSVPCTAFADGVGKMGDHFNSIKTYFDALVKVAQSLQKTVADLEKASPALAALAQQLGTRGRTRIDNIDRALGNAGNAANTGIGILETQVLPAAEKLTQVVLQQTATHVTDISVCFNKMTVLAAEMGTDFGQAVGLAFEASFNLVDGNQVLQNLQRQGADGVNAAGRAAQSNWNAVNTANATLNQSLWGVPVGTVNLPRTATHIATLDLKRINTIASDVAKLADRVGKLVGTSVDAGKAAFLDRDKLKTDSRAKFDAASDKARKAAIEVAKARAKADARKRAQTAAPRLTVQVAALDRAQLTKKFKKVNIPR